MDGPYPFGGGSWTLGNGGSLGRGNGHEDEPSLLLLAGGTGVTAWLPALKSGGSGASRMQRRVHLVWCVRTEGDLAALAPCLPLEQVHGVAVTVFVTRASGASGEHLPSPSTMSEAGGIETATLASSFAHAPLMRLFQLRRSPLRCPALRRGVLCRAAPRRAVLRCHHAAAAPPLHPPLRRRFLSQRRSSAFSSATGAGVAWRR